MEIQKIKVSKIVPDENQPRKYFNAAKLASLKASVKKHGVLSPITVEDFGNGQYLLVDGERRFRVASDLELKEIPAIVTKPKNAIERVIEQFHIQEQREGWTAAEKAMALTRMSKEMEIPITQLAELLGLAERTARTYASFGGLHLKEEFMKSEAPLEWAETIRGLRTATKRIAERELDEEFTITDEKKLEKSIIQRIANNTIRTSRDIVKLKDSFKKEPKSISEFMNNSELTPAGLFIRTKAQGEFHLRNAKNHAGYLATNLNRLMENRSTKIDKDTALRLVETYKILKKALDTAGIDY